jgi:dihydropteroate synthase
MYSRAHYGDVVTEVSAELTARAEAAVAAGVDPAQLILDPGLGFAFHHGRSTSPDGHGTINRVWRMWSPGLYSRTTRGPR